MREDRSGSRSKPQGPREDVMPACPYPHADMRRCGTRAVTREAMCAGRSLDRQIPYIAPRDMRESGKLSGTDIQQPPTSDAE